MRRPSPRFRFVALVSCVVMSACGGAQDQRPRTDSAAPAAAVDTQQLKDTARRWILGLFDQGDFGLIDQLASPDWTFRINANEPVKAQAFRQMVTELRAAFPDLNNTIHEQVAEGDVVVTRGTTRGTHRGTINNIPATNQAVAVDWVIFTRFAGGRIVEDREISDELTFLRQVGVVRDN